MELGEIKIRLEESICWIERIAESSGDTFQEEVNNFMGMVKAYEKDIALAKRVLPMGMIENFEKRAEHIYDKFWNSITI